MNDEYITKEVVRNPNWPETVYSDHDYVFLVEEHSLAGVCS